MKKTLTLAALLLFFCAANAQELKVGDKAPKIVQSLLDGEEFDLESLKGKVVLVDFWASWCRPCRKENPTVLAAYQEFKDAEFKNGTGFTVVSVSLDKNKTAWERAIQQDKLEWPYHISDLQGWDNAVAKDLGIRSIPASILIDGDGTVVAINPRGKKLKSSLKKLTKDGSGWLSW